MLPSQRLVIAGVVIFWKKKKVINFAKKPPETYCTGIIYEKATLADIEERNSWDKTALWLVLIVFALAIIVTWFIIHSITKYNNQLL